MRIYDRVGKSCSMCTFSIPRPLWSPKTVLPHWHSTWRSHHSEMAWGRGSAEELVREKFSQGVVRAEKVNSLIRYALCQKGCLTSGDGLNAQNYWLSDLKSSM